MTFAELLMAFTAWAQLVVGDWGYLGIFLVSLVANFSIIFPIPSFALVFAFGGILNPWLVGLAGGAGAALGELSGYAIGRGGRIAIKKRYQKRLKRVRTWTLTHGIFPIIILFGATPLPSDIVGVLAGIIRYDLKKFLLANFIGKTILHTAIAFAGLYSFEAVHLFLG